MQTTNEMIANIGSMLTRQVQPVENGVGFTLLDPTDCPQAVALDQHRHRIQKYFPIGAQSFKEGSFVSTKSVVTSGAVITTFSMAIDFDVVRSYLCEVWTKFLIAPLLLSLHRASPRLAGCANHNSKMGFPGLAGQHL